MLKRSPRRRLSAGTSESAIVACNSTAAAASRQVDWQRGSRVVNLESRLRWVLLVPSGPMRWTASARLMNYNPASARTRIERRLEGEVKSGERLHRRQLSLLDRHFDAADR